ncbi:hypothetical protein D3C76_1818330 [compost metagenome]
MTCSIHCKITDAQAAVHHQLSINIAVNDEFLRNIEFKRIATFIGVAILYRPFIFDPYGIAQL